MEPIEGLRVFIPSSELRELLIDKADLIRSRIEVEKVIPNVNQAVLEKMAEDAGFPPEPIKMLFDMATRGDQDGLVHEAKMLEFVAEHLREDVDYDLGLDDLTAIGVFDMPQRIRRKYR